MVNKEQGAVSQVEAADKEAADLWNELEESDASAKPASEAAPDEPAGASEQTQEAPPPQSPVADPWQNVPADLRDAYAKERERAVSSAARASFLQKRLNEIEAERAARERANEGAGESTASSFKDRLKALEEDYPEIAGPLKALAETVDEKVARLEAAEQGRQEAAEYQTAAFVEAEARQLDGFFPGWQDLLRQHGQSFVAWVNDQPMAIRQAAERNANAIVDAQETAAVLTSFIESVGLAPTKTPQEQVQNRRERQLAGSSTPRASRSAPVVTGIPRDADPQAIWDAVEAEEARQSR